MYIIVVYNHQFDWPMSTYMLSIPHGKAGLFDLLLLLIRELLLLLSTSAEVATAFLELSKEHVVCSCFFAFCWLPAGRV